MVYKKLSSKHTSGCSSDILSFWDKDKTFEKSISSRKLKRMLREKPDDQISKEISKMLKDKDITSRKN